MRRAPGFTNDRVSSVMTSRFQPDDSIDLHGYSPDAAMEQLRRRVETSRRKGSSLEVVHGHGRYILRDRVREYGLHSPLVKQVWNGEDLFLPGGGGVTVFFF